MDDAARPRLPTGVTGFWTEGRVPPPQVDPKVFIAACHAVARAAGGSAEPAESGFRHTNYLSTALRDRSGTVRVVCNVHHPLIAFYDAAGDVEQPIPFVDRPDLAALFEQLTDFRPLSLDTLNAQVTAEAVAALDAAELSQIRYWRPDTIGEVVFNFWD